MQTFAAEQGYASGMKQKLVKLIDSQELLHVACAAVGRLLSCVKEKADDLPADQLAAFIQSCANEFAGADWVRGLAGGRCALAAAGDGRHAGSNVSAWVNLFPQVHAVRKEAPVLQAAIHNSTGQGSGSPEKHYSKSKSIGPQNEPEQWPARDAIQVAKIWQETLEEFEYLDESAEEIECEPLSDTVKNNAWQLTMRFLDEYPDHYSITADYGGRVTICFSKCDKHYCSIDCEADGSVLCIVIRNNSASDKHYASIEGLPDDFMRQALAPQPEAGSR